ncbi:MAG: hypothetical protein LBD85_06980 [Oscillospiraceae bacterium]|nr:hypothetical protein [Oscillospiraceae bacterium]
MAAWVLTVAAASFVGGLAAAITPRGKQRDLVCFIAGLMTIAVMLTAAGRIDFGAYTNYLEEFELQLSEPAALLQADSDAELISVIKEKTAAYIWDKTGVEVNDIRLEQFDDDGYPIPVEVWLNAVYDAAASEILTKELGIAAGNQHWYT